MEVLEWIWIVIKNGLIIIGIFYLIPYLIRRGWGDAENKTKKVCDTCFRDIKKWNEVCEKALKKEGLIVEEEV